MADMKIVKPERLWLRNHAVLNEKWVADQIVEDPSILGVGDVVVKDRERIQPHAGRLDLLLQDTESSRRYEVEIQLGKTDESHIIRTIEYWDVERKRYPQYDHCAVIVAEDITARFLNVISLFNGMIPLIAIQMNALKLGDAVALVFTKVLDELKLGLVGDDEVEEVTDRAYWEDRGTKQTVSMADEVLDIIRTFASGYELKYNKFYIGLAKGGQTDNFVVFRAKKNHLRLELRMEDSQQLRQRLDQAGLDMMEYDTRWGRCRIRLSKGDVQKHEDLLKELLKQAHGEAS